MSDFQGAYRAYLCAALNGLVSHYGLTRHSTFEDLAREASEIASAAILREHASVSDVYQAAGDAKATASGALR